MLLKQFAVIGLGRFGRAVARELSKMGYDVLAIDKQEDRVNEIADEVTHAVQISQLDDEVLKKLGIRNFDVVIVAIGQDIQANILTTAILKEIGVKYVVAKAQTALHGKVLEKVGADRIVYPERDMGIRVAHSLGTANILDFIELSPTHSIIEIRVSKRISGKTLGQLNLRAKYGITVIALKKGAEILASPGADAKIDEMDILVVIGLNDQLEKFENL